jgi:hypothetical protein
MNHMDVPIRRHAPAEAVDLPGAFFERSHIDYDDGSYREMMASRLRILALGYWHETICRAKPVNGLREK